VSNNGLFTGYISIGKQKTDRKPDCGDNSWVGCLGACPQQRTCWTDSL